MRFHMHNVLCSQLYILWGILQVWDLRSESQPVETYQVHEYLRTKLCSLYENDCIFDKFECAWSGNDRYFYQLNSTIPMDLDVK